MQHGQKRVVVHTAAQAEKTIQRVLEANLDKVAVRWQTPSVTALAVAGAPS